MVWKDRWEKDYFYGIMLIISAIGYIILKQIAFDYRLIFFGFAIGLFFSYIFTELNKTWDNSKSKDG